ncbi:hypothetical protein YC2023_119757 [Brassica napus]
MRKLKYHEKKVLKKLNFLEWKREGAWPTAQQMDPTDPFRIQMTDMLLDKLLSFTYQCVQLLTSNGSFVSLGLFNKRVILFPLLLHRSSLHKLRYRS